MILRGFDFFLIFDAQNDCMQKDKILVIGASGQIGVELTLALRKMYGNNNVVASDLREETHCSKARDLM